MAEGFANPDAEVAVEGLEGNAVVASRVALLASQDRRTRARCRNEERPARKSEELHDGREEADGRRPPVMFHASTRTIIRATVSPAN